MISNDSQVVRPSKAPNLPVAPVDYDRSYFDNLMSILRLYFVTIDNAIRQLLYGFKVDGSYYSTSTQAVAAANAVTLATYNGVDNEVGVRIDNVVTSRIIVERAGIFEVQVTAETDKTGGGSGTLYIWLRVNGVNVVNTAGEYTVTGASIRACITRVFRVTLDAEDYVEVAYSSADSTMRLLTVAAAGNVPAVPSIRTTVTFIAPI